MLVQQACAVYDKGAECIAAAAGIGFPEAGSEEDRRFTEALDCGFASSEAGRTLSDAVSKSDQIRSKL